MTDQASVNDRAEAEWIQLEPILRRAAALEGIDRQTLDLQHHTETGRFVYDFAHPDGGRVQFVLESPGMVAETRHGRNGEADEYRTIVDLDMRQMAVEADILAEEEEEGLGEGRS